MGRLPAKTLSAPIRVHLRLFYRGSSFAKYSWR